MVFPVVQEENIFLRRSLMFKLNSTFSSLRVVFVFVLMVSALGIFPAPVNADTVGSISGTIYDADGVTLIENIYVAASGDPGYFASDCTDASGQFTLPDLPLDVQLQVQAAPPWANCGSWSDRVQEFWQESGDANDASSVVLTSGNPDATGIDFTLDAGGAISGTVYAADGVTPLENIAVSFHDEYVSDYNQSVCTDATGHYEFHGAPFDMPLLVSTYAYHDNWCNAGGNYISEYWQGSSDLTNATLVTVNSLSPMQANIDFTLDPAGSISGTVYEADGVTPVPDIPVRIFGDHYWGESPVTDNMGKYTIHNVPFGLSVYLYAGDASLCVGANSHAVEFWSESVNLNTASLVSVSALAPDFTGADFTLNSVSCDSSNPSMRAWYVDDKIEADDWPTGTQLTLEIEDMTTPASPDYSTAMEVNESTEWFNLKGQFDIKPGMFVVLSGASMSRVVRVDNLTITNIDQDLDTITGTTGGPTNWLWMWFNSPSCCRSTVADRNGVWVFDFSVPGPNGEAVVDIGPGSAGAAHVPSGDGSTSVEWSIPYKTLHVVPAHPEVHGHDWSPGTDVTLTIDDDTNSGNGVLYTQTKNVDVDPLWCGYPCFDLDGLFTLQVGQYVSLSDGTNTKTVHISPLTITEVNMDADTISGIADPGSRVAVNIWSQNGLARYVTTEPDGTWLADFSVVGDESFEQFTTDITYGDNGRAIQLNPDGTDDGTLEYWNTPSLVTSSYKSIGSQDGWVLESSETSNKGGTLNSAMTTFRLGDDATKKQYRGILSFNTSSIPDNAVITKVTLKVEKQGITGGSNPVIAFQGFMVDIKKGLFGTAALQVTDFQTAANKTYGPFKPTPVSNWYSINLTSGKPYINKLSSSGGLTQIRLYFKLDDNNNTAANYLSLFSGNASTASRPQLIVEYYVP